MNVTVDQMNDKINSAIAFISGDLLTTIIFIYGSLEAIDFLHPFLKVVLALIVGITGGFGGLLGKDLYEKFKETVRNHYKK